MNFLKDIAEAFVQSAIIALAVPVFILAFVLMLFGCFVSLAFLLTMYIALLGIEIGDYIAEKYN
jgi:hypothetical protein